MAIEYDSIRINDKIYTDSDKYTIVYFNKTYVYLKKNGKDELVRIYTNDLCNRTIISIDGNYKGIFYYSENSDRDDEKVGIFKLRSIITEMQSLCRSLSFAKQECDNDLIRITNISYLYKKNIKKYVDALTVFNTKYPQLIEELKELGYTYDEENNKITNVDDPKDNYDLPHVNKKDLVCNFKKITIE